MAGAGKKRRGDNRERGSWNVAVALPDSDSSLQEAGDYRQRDYYIKFMFWLALGNDFFHIGNNIITLVHGCIPIYQKGNHALSTNT